MPSVLAAVEELRDAEQTVWLTGHSLGGGLAMLAALRRPPALRPRRLHLRPTPHLQPRLANAHDKALTGRTFE